MKKPLLTPADIPDDLIVRCIRIPASQEWLGVVNSALLEMTAPWNYEQIDDTDITPEQAAQRAYQIYTDYLLGDCQSMFTCDNLLNCAELIQDIVGQSPTLFGDIIINDHDGIVAERWPEAERESELYSPPPACDNDYLWSGLKEIVTRIDQYGLDWLELLVANADLVQRIAEAIEVVPLLGSVASTGLDLLAGEAENLRNAYSAYSSESVIEEITCDLFALVCNDCRYPTHDELLNYYASLGIQTLQDYLELSFEYILSQVVASSGFTNQVVYHTVNLFQLVIRGMNGEFLGQRGTRYISLWAKLGQDSPSSDHEVLCPCTEPPPQDPTGHGFYDPEVGWPCAEYEYTGQTRQSIYKPAETEYLWRFRMDLQEVAGSRQGYAMSDHPFTIAGSSGTFPTSTLRTFPYPWNKVWSNGTYWNGFTNATLNSGGETWHAFFARVTTALPVIDVHLWIRWD